MVTDTRPAGAGDLWLAPGRLLFGFAILGFGVVGLYYLDFLHSLQPVPARLPGYTALAVLNGLVLAGAGAAIVANRWIRPAALAFSGLLVASFVLLHVPSAFVEPELLRSPWWIRTFESLALVGAALTLIGLRDTPADERRIRIGRIAFGISLPVFGVLHFVYADWTANLIPPWYPWPLFLVYLTGAAQIVGGLAIAAGLWARLAAILAGAMYGAFALTLHVPRIGCRLAGPCEFLDAPVGLAAARGEITSMFVAFGMWGAAWVVAGAIGRQREAEGAMG